MSEDRKRPLAAPVAKAVPKTLEKHGHVRVDPYFWLRDREDPEVLAYIQAENDYLAQEMAPLAELQEKLFQEMVGRVKQDDSSVPYRQGEYFYYKRFETGAEYPLYCRKHGSLQAEEQVILDVPRLAAGHSFFSIGATDVNSRHDVLAFTADTVGRRKYDIRFRDLRTGELLPDLLPQRTPNIAWAEDGETLFYARQHPETLRWDQIWRHRLGTDPKDDVLVFEEADPEYRCYVVKSQSRRMLFVVTAHKNASEVWYADAATPDAAFRVMEPRQLGHEYQADHLGDRFYIRTNWQARNFRLMQATEQRPARDGWSEVVPARDEVFLERFELFRDHLVLQERRNGLVELRVRPWSGEGEHTLDFGEPAYQASFDQNHEPDTTVLRYAYTSLKTPRSIYDYDMNTRHKTLLKRDEVLGGFDPDDYQTERLWAPARDGKRVPVSLVYRKGFVKDGSHPLLLFGYGSYGHVMDAEFRPSALSLLERGFAFAIAHVRGGQDLGRPWYEDGKLLKKRNTFTDFVDCAEYLIAQKYTSASRLFAEGGSAGGLLMGAVVNLRPELWKGVVARMPFVDVLTSMLDESIPLTTIEYAEWGDPNDKTYYDLMLSYSPYDNVEAKAYPNLIVITGLHDSQVQYWEPLKWVAKLRALKTDGNRLLLHTQMEAGHHGATGRFKRLRQNALAYAFVLDLAGIRK